jgi:hypothetical protein
VMVLIDLAEICRKLQKSSAVPSELRTQAGKFVAEFEVLLPHRGKGTAMQHGKGETLLTQIARFLPRVIEVQALPANAENVA